MKTDSSQTETYFNNPKACCFFKMTRFSIVIKTRAFFSRLLHCKILFHLFDLIFIIHFSSSPLPAQCFLSLPGVGTHPLSLSFHLSIMKKMESALTVFSLQTPKPSIKLILRLFFFLSLHPET